MEKQADQPFKGQKIITARFEEGNIPAPTNY